MDWVPTSAYFAYSAVSAAALPRYVSALSGRQYSVQDGQDGGVIIGPKDWPARGDNKIVLVASGAVLVGLSRRTGGAYLTGQSWKA